MVHAVHKAQVEFFNPLSRPRRPPQEGQTGFNARVNEKAAHRQFASHCLPTDSLDQRRDDGVERDALQRGGR